MTLRIYHEGVGVLHPKGRQKLMNWSCVIKTILHIYADNLQVPRYNPLFKFKQILKIQEDIPANVLN